MLTLDCLVTLNRLSLPPVSPAAATQLPQLLVTSARAGVRMGEKTLRD